jgi:hypothetical protein
VLDAGLTRINLGLGDAVGIQIYADSARSMPAGRENHNPPVTAAQVVDRVSRADLGYAKHFLGHFNGRWHKYGQAPRGK